MIDDPNMPAAVLYPSPAWCSPRCDGRRMIPGLAFMLGSDRLLFAVPETSGKNDT